MIMQRHQTANIAKGVGIGLAVGGAVGLVGGAMRQPQYQRAAKKGFNKVLKSVSQVIESIA